MGRSLLQYSVRSYFINIMGVLFIYTLYNIYRYICIGGMMTLVSRMMNGTNFSPYHHRHIMLRALPDISSKYHKEVVLLFLNRRLGTTNVRGF